MSASPGPWRALRWWEVINLTLDEGDDRAEMEAAPIIRIEAADGTAVAAAHDLFEFTADNARLLEAAPDIAEALRALYTECDAFQHEELNTHPTWGPIMRAARAALTKAGIATEPAVVDPPRWRCPCCKGTNVQISFPTWYRETRDNDLQYIDVDSEAEILWWYCDDCDETDIGSPEEIEDEG